MLRFTAFVVLLISTSGAAPARAPLAVTDMTPAPGSVLIAAPTEILVTLDAAPDALSVGTSSVVVTRAGADTLLGTGDDVTVNPASVTVVGGTDIRIDLTGALMPDDLYQVRVRGDEAPISGLVSHWRLDEGAGTTAADSSGGGFPGTVSGATWTTGRLGGALSFDGGINRVTVGAPDVPYPWTCAMWVYRFDSPMLDSRVTDGTTSLRVEQYNNTNQAGITQGGVADYVLSYTVPTGAWTHLTWVSTGGGTSLYANGSPVATLPGLALPLGRAAIGSSGGNTFLGTIDDVRVYNRLLTPTEILAAYRLGGAVRDSIGVALDGEFSGTFPSGNASPGGDFVATFTINSLVPSAPSMLSAAASSTTTIRLTWTDNASNEAGFRIERGTDGSTFAEIAVTAADAESYDDTAAAGSATLFYRVRATNAAGDSSYSNVASAQPIQVSEKKKCGALGIEVLLPLGLLALRRRIRKTS